MFGPDPLPRREGGALRAFAEGALIAALAVYQSVRYWLGAKTT